MTGEKQFRAVCWTMFGNSQTGEFPSADQVKEYLTGVSAYAFQLEISPTTQRPHWQGWCRHTGAKTFSQWKKLLPGAHIEQQKSRYSSKASDYCAKEETRARPAELVALGMDPAMIGPHLRNVIISGPKIISELNDGNMYPWQHDMLSMYNAPVDPRKIIWVWETEGNTGKSALARHMAIGGHTLVVAGQAADVKAGVAAWHKPEKGKVVQDLNLLIWDIPRCNNGHMSYQALEELKNGCFYSPKYESGMVVTKKPHVWVFSNQAPELEKLSKDRWELYMIKNKQLQRMEPTYAIFNPASAGGGAGGHQAFMEA